MNYTITNLTQIDDCNLLLTWAAKEKGDLAFKKTAEERLTVKFAETSMEIEATLQGVLADLDAEEHIIASLPEGSVKEEHVVKRTKLQYKRFLLETRKESYGVIALLQKESDVARIDREIAEVDVFIAVVEEKKQGLAA